MRFRDIEFRWSKCNNKYELVRWYQSNGSGQENCYVIAFFDKDKECYNMSLQVSVGWDDYASWPALVDRVFGRIGLPK